MRTFWFWILRAHGAGFERLAVLAASAYEAILALPPCVSWNFSKEGMREVAHG
jgi:hypothetical protein